MDEPRAGEVWDVNFDPTLGREQRGLRPALVISNNEFNELPNGLFLVVPITGRDRNVVTHVRLKPPAGGLSKPSVAMCDQVKAQSIVRFRRKRGEVSQDVLRQVQAVVSLIIDR